nr:DUF2523 domain-containing protein [uncultured Deefgea sp.]
MALPLAMIIPAIISGLATGAATIVGRALIGLGVAVFTYKGITVSLDLLLNQIKSSFSSLPPEICGISNLLQIDVCISILFSAYAASLALGGLTGDTVKRWGIK